MSTRAPYLDVLRFAAIALVLGRHIFVCSGHLSTWLHSATQFWCNLGWVGVDVFFVLSGFLVSGLLFQEQQQHGRMSVARFYVRRGFKIYPGYWALLLVTLVVMLWNFHSRFAGQVTWAQFWPFIQRWFWPNALFLQNYIPDVDSDLVWSIRLTWSLAVEEHFYLLLPLLLLAVRGPGRNFRLLPVVVFMAALLCLCLRLGQPGPFTTQQHLMPTHLRMDGLLFGVLLSYWQHYYPKSFRNASEDRNILLALSALCFLPAAVWNLGTTPFLWTCGYTLNWLGAGCLLLACSGTALGTGALGQCLAAIGQRSYSIYLWHPVTAWVAGKLFNPMATLVGWTGWVLVYLGGAVAVGWFAAWALEFPLLRLRDRYFPRRHL
jgi:peptidoglycan/LPS O-acetylase OafA/YrhL